MLHVQAACPPLFVFIACRNVREAYVPVIIHCYLLVLLDSRASLVGPVRETFIVVINPYEPAE